MKRDNFTLPLDFSAAPMVQTSTPARRCGMPRSVALMWERAESPAVQEAVLAICAARKGQWLSWNDFRMVIDKHQIGGCFGHVLAGVAREGLIQEQIVYHGKGIGAEKPGSPNYQGFGHKWSAT